MVALKGRSPVYYTSGLPSPHLEHVAFYLYSEGTNEVTNVMLPLSLLRKLKEELRWVRDEK